MATTTTGLHDHIQQMSESLRHEWVVAFNGSVRDLVKAVINEFPDKAEDSKSLYNKFLTAIQINPRLPVSFLQAFLVSKEPGNRLTKQLDSKDEKFFTDEICTIPLLSDFNFHLMWPKLNESQKNMMWRHVLKITNIARTLHTTDELVTPAKVEALESAIKDLLPKPGSAAPAEPPKLEAIAQTVAAKLGFSWTPEMQAHLQEVKKQVQQAVQNAPAPSSGAPPMSRQELLARLANI